MTYEPLYHKYRPQSFAELVGQDAIAQTLSNALNQQRIAHAYLFTGPRGTGKTSSARILAKSLNCIKGDAPTDSPCGVCEICRSITQGNSLDVIEIDAASNTGVDNIRELIERSQFAPAQCRYKVYVVDECLTGDALILTHEGPIRIDDPSILGRSVLSYNDISGIWEFKPVVRWLDQGKRQTFIIKTAQQEICCTGNHLIRTDQGWIAAQDVRNGMKILSPANAGAAISFTSTAPMVESADLSQATSSKAIAMDKKPMILKPSWHKQQPLVPLVPADAVKNWLSQNFFGRKAKEFKVSSLIGYGIHINPTTVFGIAAPSSSSIVLPNSILKFWDSYTVPSWETVRSLILTPTAVFPVCLGRMENHKKHGWNIKQIGLPCYAPVSEQLKIKGMARFLLAVIQPAIHSLLKYFSASSPLSIRNKSLKIGSEDLPRKVWHGGTWMMVPLALAMKGVQQFNFILKDILPLRINLSPIGLPSKAILPSADLTVAVAQEKPITTWLWGQMRLGNGLSTFRSMRSQLWHTNLETVESVSLGGIESVYDIEVEDNHNFVANGLLVHNCHMLSTAAFNALLKTLEEPPPRVVFVLATTDPQRVLPTIISRCQRFDFRRIPLDAMVAHLVAIARQENIAIDPAAVQLVGQLAQGGLRDAESLLDQLSLLPTTITPEAVWDLVGAVPEQSLLQLVQVIHQGSPEQILDCVRELMDRGREPLIVLQNLASFYRDMLIAKTAANRADLVAITAQTWQQLCEFVQSLDVGMLLRGQQHLRSSEIQVKNTTQPRLWLEITLLGLIPSALGPVSVPSPQPIRNFNPPPQTPATHGSPQPQIAAPQPTPAPQIAPVFPSTPAPQPLPQSASAILETPIASDPSPTIPATQPFPAALADGAKSTDSISTEKFLSTAPSAQQSASFPQVSDHAQTGAGDNQSPHASFASGDPNLVPTAFSPTLPAASASSPTGGFSAPETDLVETWNQVIPYIQPALTQVLARQQCRLLGFRGSQARVGVKTQALLKIAQSKLPNFEAAFQAVFQRIVKVTVEVIATDIPITPAAPTTTNPPAYIPQTFGNPPSPQAQTFPVQPAPIQPALIQPPAIQPPAIQLPTIQADASTYLTPERDPLSSIPDSPAVIHHQTPETIQPPNHPVAAPMGVPMGGVPMGGVPMGGVPVAIATPAMILATDIANQSQPPTQTIPAWEPPSELDRAVKSLAELFRGQIVSLEPGESGQELEIGGEGFSWDTGASDPDD